MKKPAEESAAARLLVRTLQRVPLFNELSVDELTLIASELTAKRFDGGQIVFHEGEPGGDLLIVKTGSVRILKTAASGRQQLISIEREGSSLGEVSVFDGGCYSTTAITITPVELLRLKGDGFRRLCSSHPEVAFKVIRVLGHRLRHLRNLVEQLSFATIRARLVAHLLHLAEKRGVLGQEGIEIELDENNEELASRLGTVRELVSRNLGRLHGEGLIRMRRRAVTIPDEDALRAEIDRA
jgi:CRP/FNR family cyclic AMP-dependent transcriptional regulator